MSDAPDLAAVPLEGKLADPTILPRLFAWLGRGEWSGAVHVRAGDVERVVYFAEGRIATAVSNDPPESLVAHILGAGVLSEADMERARSVLPLGEHGGAAGRQLVRLGLLGEKDLVSIDRRRAVGVTEAALGLRSGSYRTESGSVGTEGLPQGIDVPRVVATAILSAWEDAWALEALGGSDAVLDVVPERLADYEATGADEAYDLTFLRANGRRTLREVLEASPLPESAALRFLAACRVLGCIDVVRRAENQKPRPVTAAAADTSLAAHVPRGHDGDEGEDAGAAGESLDDGAAASSADAPPAPRPPRTPVPPTARAAAARSGGATAPEAARRGVSTPVLVACAALVVIGLLYLAWKGWREQLRQGAPPGVEGRP